MTALLWNRRIRESIRLTGLEGRAVPMTGDYLADDIGEGYDLIMAIATLSFVEQELASLMKKLYKAMNPGGVLLCYSEGIERDGSGPWDMMLGWLPYNMQGYDLGLKKNEIAEAAMQPASGALRNGPGSIPRAMWMWIYSENNLTKSLTWKMQDTKNREAARPCGTVSLFFV